MVLCTTVAAVAQNAGNHTLTICANGQLNGFGRNTGYQLGLGYGNTSDEHSPVDIPTMTNVVCAAAGESHSLAVLSDGTVWAWGSNSAGSAGQPYPSVLSVYSPTQVMVSGCAVAVSAGASFSLVLLADSTVWAWGLDANGQLGNDLATSTTYGTPVQVAGITNAVAISAGSQNGMALLADGTVKTWGAGTLGELGNSAWVDKFTPVPVTAVSGFSNIVKIDAGGSHCIALNGSNQVFTWGSDLWGQLGNGTGISHRNTPQLISSFSTSGTVTDVAAGADFSIVIRSNGTTRACGNNNKKQTTKCPPITNQHTPIAGFTFPSTGDFAVASTALHGVYINGSAQLYTWGQNLYGNIGNGTTSGSVCNPVLINGSGSGICSMIPSEDNHPQPCCVAVREDSRIQLGASGNQTYSGGFNYIGQNLSINNTITLQSGSYYFTTCDVVCWKDAKIVVKNSASLYIRTNSHLYACGDMWDGIYVEDGGSVWVYSGSIIEDAEVALDVQKNGKYYLVDATLNKNYIHLRHTGPSSTGGNPYRIMRSKFLCQESIIPFNTAHTNLLPPRQNEFTATQIVATNVNKLYLGSSGNGNKFDHAIYGAMINGVTDVEVLYNDFDDVAFLGTWVTNTPNVSGAQIDINYNTYDKSIYPIFCYDNDVTVKTHITNNTISFNGMVSPPPTGMVGITVDEITPASGSNLNFVDVSQNTIYKAPTGIFLRNLKGDNNNQKASIYIYDNTITHQQSSSEQGAGIKLEYVVQSSVVDNNISHPTSGINWWETAIRSSSGSNGNGFYCNYLHHIGNGILFNGYQNTNTVVANNDFERNHRAFMLNWGDVGPQNTSYPYPHDNEWKETSYWDLANSKYTTQVIGTHTHTTSFGVRVGPTSVYYPNHNHRTDVPLGQVITANVIGNTWPYACVVDGLHANFKTDGSEQESANEMPYLNVMQPAEAQSEREANQQWIGKYGLYDRLMRDEELRISSSELESFFVTSGNDNIGRLQHAVSEFQLARDGGMEITDNLQDVQPHNSVEQTLLDVLSLLYANAADLSSLNNEEAERLREIAVRCPLDDGFGVYMARSALLKLDTLPRNYHNDCELLQSPDEQRNKTIASEDVSEFSIYPNPSNGQFTLAYQMNEMETGEIRMFDMVGKQVFAQTVSGEAKMVNMNLSELSTGLYLISLEVNGEVRFAERLSILK